MGAFLEVLRQTAIFMLAAQMILHFLPGEKYGKYGKLIVSVLVFSQLAVPILSLGDMDFTEEFMNRLDQMEQENTIFTQEMESLSRQQDSFLMEDLVGSVEVRLEEEAMQNKVTICEVYLEDDVVVIEVQNVQNTKTKKTLEMEPIRVDQVTIEAEGENSTEEALDSGKTAVVGAEAKRGKRRSDLENVFAARLGMNQGQVEVIELE